MSILDSDIKQPTLVETLVAGVRNTLNSSRIGGVDIARMALATESLREDQVNSLLAARDSMSVAFEAFVKSNPGVNINVKAGTLAGLVAADPKGFLSKSYVALEGAINGLDAGDQVDGHSIALDVYDETANTNLQTYSVVYNMLASRQDEFGEAFFPTVTIAPDQAGVSVNVRLLSVINDKQRDLTGKLTDFNRKNILRAYADPTILKNDMTRAIPVYRQSSASNFVDPNVVPPRVIVVDDESITTSALRMGTTMDLITLSQRDSQLAKGAADITDSLHPSMVLDRIYVKVGDDVMSFRTKDLPLSTFIQTGQDYYRLMTLNFNTNAMLLNKDTKRIDGSDLVTLKTVKDNDLIVRIRAVVTGSAELATGATTMYGNSFQVYSVKNSDGENLDLNSGTGKTVVDAFKDAQIIGCDITAYLTNSNRANRGQLLYTDYFTQPYSVPTKSPLTSIRPVMTDQMDDSSDVSNIVTATNIRTSNSAVTSLIEAAALLREYVSVADAGDAPAILGVSRFLVLPYYKYVSVDMATEISSLTSHDRADDIVAVLLNRIRDNVLHMWTSSQYMAASNAINGGEAAKPTVLIGTDPIIHRYLVLNGDYRTISEQFNVKIVETLDVRVRGKMFITFTTNPNGTIDPLNFGNMLWAPELVFTSKITRNNRFSYETSVSPRFAHIVNMPLLVEMDITGITDSLSNIPINIKNTN